VLAKPHLGAVSRCVAPLVTSSSLRYATCGLCADEWSGSVGPTAGEVPPNTSSWVCTPAQPRAREGGKVAVCVMASLFYQLRTTPPVSLARDCLPNRSPLMSPHPPAAVGRSKVCSSSLYFYCTAFT
jgi:hypothetical protein